MAPETTGPDYGDPAVQEEWCMACQGKVIQYLSDQGVDHGQVGRWPALHVAPILAIWPIESKQWPGKLGWWVICGDLPTDHVSGCMVHHPRAAMQAFGERWREAAAHMARGEPLPDGSRVGRPEDWPSLAPLVASRAEALLDWAADDAWWEADGSWKDTG